MVRQAHHFSGSGEINGFNGGARAVVTAALGGPSSEAKPNQTPQAFRLGHRPTGTKTFTKQGRYRNLPGSLMSILINLLLAVHIFVCLLLVLVILMQLPRSEGLGAAFGGTVTDNIFGAQTTNVLAKFTVWLGVAFFAITLLLAIAYTHANTGKSGVQRLLDRPVPAAAASPAASPGASPVVNATAVAPAAVASPAASPVATPAAAHTP